MFSSWNRLWEILTNPVAWLRCPSKNRPRKPVGDHIASPYITDDANYQWEPDWHGNHLRNNGGWLGGKYNELLKYLYWQWEAQVWVQHFLTGEIKEKWCGNILFHKHFEDGKWVWNFIELLGKAWGKFMETIFLQPGNELLIHFNIVSPNFHQTFHRLSTNFPTHFQLISHPRNVCEIRCFHIISP